MANAVFEIFTEELPATLQKTIASDYLTFSKKALGVLQININDDDVVVGITPNRMVLKLTNCDIDTKKLQQLAEEILKNFSKNFPRTMNYPQMTIRWLRPIRSLFLCIDDEVIQGEFFGLQTNGGTYIDKFEFKKCNSFDEYFKILKENAIEINYNRRLEFVKNEVSKYKLDYKNKSLLEELAGMSEYCVEPMVAVLNQKFEKLPFELIELVLRENQRYVVYKEGSEIKFLIFGGKITQSKNSKEQVLQGHQKVIEARLDDAVYYFEKDKQELTKFGENEYKNELTKSLLARTFVDNITFEEYLQKQKATAKNLPKNDIETFEKVKELIFNTKIDLATHVVAEFPELQGIIGGYYFNYEFNPYFLDKNKIQSEKNEVLYYYLTDRIAYISTMYQQDKQPTGSGDKYKVKARMDDVVAIFIEKMNDLNLADLTDGNDEIKKLFLKRLQKYIEDTYKDIKNIKQFAEVATKIIDKAVFFDIKTAVSYFSNEKFLKIYKRINGYTKNIKLEENDDIRQKVEKAFNGNDLLAMESFLDNQKIKGNAENEKMLKYIEATFFNKNLPVEFLEIA